MLWELKVKIINENQGNVMEGLAFLLDHGD